MCTTVPFRIANGEWGWLPLAFAGRVWRTLVLGLCLAAAGVAARADDLLQPAGPVLLTVSGQIKHTNAAGEARFDRAMLESLGLVSLVTRTAWTEGPQVFEGVPARALLAAVGAVGGTAHAVALNDYEMDIPVSDFSDYEVLIALKMNGSYMRVRDKGPLWVVYPRDQYPELDRPEVWSRWVWQLKRIEVR